MRLLDKEEIGGSPVQPLQTSVSKKLQFIFTVFEADLACFLYFNWLVNGQRTDTESLQSSL